MRGDVRRHADGNSARAVNEKIRNARRQNDWFFACLIEIRDEVDGFFFEVRKNVFADFRQARFGISHGRGRIAVHGTEIPLSVDQRITHVEVLRQAHQRGIDHRFSMRMVVAGRVSADFGALAVAPIGSEAEVVHRDKNAPLHRLQPVADVGQRARNDDAHCVVEIGLAHFRFDIDRKQY